MRFCFFKLVQRKINSGFRFPSVLAFDAELNRNCHFEDETVQYLGDRITEDVAMDLW
jgi:hypothetical protein